LNFVLDCTAPFSVYIKTDGLIDAATTAAAVPNNRGIFSTVKSVQQFKAAM
jgi:hypothetical protein